MTAPAGAQDQQYAPGLGTTYEGHDPALLNTILPLVDYIETTPDSITHVVQGRAILHEPTVQELARAADRVSLLLHGIGLSIGSCEGWSDRYIGFLDELIGRLPILWHSEHIGYTRVNGENIGTMLAMPRTGEALDLLCDRVSRIQARYDKPFLLENIIHMLPEYPGEYTAAEFLNELTARTGCGLILDVYNLECDERNHDFDVEGFLADLNLAAVREIHVACGSELDGFLLDAHSKVTRPSTLALARQVIRAARGSVQVVTYELLREAVQAVGHAGIAEELLRLRGELCS
jgi:uncharacterized protein (UPF0276 family)